MPAKGDALGAFNQVAWTGVFDADECWIIATYWGLVATGVLLMSELPTIKAFRAASGRPDRQGKVDGGNNTIVMKALKKLVPQADARMFKGGLDQFTKLLKQGYVASLSVDSGDLPKYLQFGYFKGHQIAVVYQGGQFYVMNPLQNQGAALLSITGQALLKAASSYLGDGKLHAIFIKQGTQKPDKPAAAPPPMQAQPMLHALPKPDYIDPFEAGKFYHGRRHSGDFILGGD